MTDERLESMESIEELRARLEEAEETLRAIRSGEVDALVVSGPRGNQIYTLKGAESTYRVLVEAMNEGALVLTPNGTIMYSNRTFADMVDMPLGQVIGSRLHQFVCEFDLETVEELLDEGQQTDSRRELTLASEPSDKIVPAQVSVANLPEGDVDGLSAVVTDLTEYKRTEAELREYRERLEELVALRTSELEKALERLETTNSQLLQEIEERKRVEESLRQSEKRYSALFNNKINGVAHCRVITDENGKPVDYTILEVNNAYEDITGIRKEDIEGKRATEVFPGIENFEFDYIGNYGRVGLEEDEINIEVFFETTRQWLSIYVYSPKRCEFIAVFTDITNRKQAELDLATAKDQLQS